jgi:hypothetical protein
MTITAPLETRLQHAVLDDDDSYGPRMRAAHGPLLATAGVAALLAHCATLDTVRPTGRWRAEAARLLAAAPHGAEVARLLLDGFTAQPECLVTVRWSYGEVTRERGLTGGVNTRLVRGLLWVVAGLDGEWVVPLAGACARYAGTGVGGSGGVSRSATVSTTAVAVLATFDGPRGEAAVRCLAALQAQVRNRTVLKGAARAQHEIARRAGLTPAQLRERAVPDAGLDARRTREVPLPGGYTAVLAVDTAAAASLAVKTAAGVTLKSVPKAVRDLSPAALAGVRAELKELRALLSAERVRLEERLAAGAEWTGTQWQRLYADHPVTGAVAGALLWEVCAAGSDAWCAGLPERGGAGWCLAGADGTAAAVGPSDRVRLWHPLRADPEDVREWRTELTARELRQPFKQVFREIYPLTPAERATAAYSSRFAGHILRFPQARSLMAARGWSAGHLGYWDGGSEGEAVRELAARDASAWRARFSYALVERERDGLDVSLCSTGRVRFERRSGARGAWSPAGLAEVPALVLSEAFRDADLFTAVASIGADPLWQDGGAGGHGEYWRRAAFGELTASGRVRAEALARLLPRTRIADRTELDGRFLRVRGDLRAYRIHLGSGNVLMEPDDSYLCIVPDRGVTAAAGRVFLPFEEDGGMLSVILSKAFLLADDLSLTDPSITHQLLR